MSSQDLLIDFNPSIGESIASNDLNFAWGFVWVYQDLNAPLVLNSFPKNGDYNSTSIELNSFDLNFLEVESRVWYCEAILYKNELKFSDLNALLVFLDDQNTTGYCLAFYDLKEGDSVLVNWRVCDYALNCTDYNSGILNYAIAPIIGGWTPPIPKITEGNVFVPVIPDLNVLSKLFKTNEFWVFAIIGILIILLTIYFIYKKLRKKGEISANA